MHNLNLSCLCSYIAHQIWCHSLLTTESVKNSLFLISLPRPTVHAFKSGLEFLYALGREGKRAVMADPCGVRWMFFQLLQHF